MLITAGFCCILLCLFGEGFGQGEEQCQERTMTDFEDGRRCRKACNLDSDCKGSLKRCLCDDVCGKSCFNPAAACDTPQSISNGQVLGDSYTYGSTITYVCDSHTYELSGPVTRQCRSDKQWTGTTPSCDVVCRAPLRVSTSFSNSSKNAYYPGEVLHYECHLGHLPSGNPFITCQDDGTWTAITLLCTRRLCPLPPVIRNGNREGNNNEYRFGSRVTYICNPGYQIAERQNFLSCDSRGRWSPTVPPTCIPISCPVPVAPAFGSVDDTGVAYQYNSEVRYSCQDGYKLEGSSTGLCNENGTWGELPTCALDTDCNFEEFQEPFCSYTATGNAWEREFSSNVNSGPRGYVARIDTGPNQSSDEAKLTSTSMSSNSESCIKFHYLLKSDPNRADFSLSMIRSAEQNNLLWQIHPTEQMNRWLSAVVQFGDSRNSNVQLEFVAKNLRSSSLSLDLDDIVVTSSCENRCSPSPCGERGICVNRMNDYQCFCSPGFEGRDCSSLINYCTAPSAIENGRIQKTSSGSRVNAGGRITITCNSNYHISDRNQQSLVLTCDAGSSWSDRIPTCDPTFQCREGDGRPCVFPFKTSSRGKSHYSCLPYNERTWCSEVYHYRFNSPWDYCIPCANRWNSWSEWGECSATNCNEEGQRSRRRTCGDGNVGGPYCTGSEIISEPCQLSSCAVVERTLDQSTYAVFKRSVNYDEAAEACREYGGALASIPNNRVNELLVNAVENLRGPNSYYIGLTDRRTEGTWRWLDDARSLSWANWNTATGEPNGGLGESCAVLLRRTGMWNDRSCEAATSPYPVNFICEKSQTTSWGTWSSCSNTCGSGMRTRTRVCLHIWGLNQYCGDLTETNPCTNAVSCTSIPIVAVWSRWSQWGDCSAACGSGQEFRRRECQNGVGGTDCAGSDLSRRPCQAPTACLSDFHVTGKTYRIVLDSPRNFTAAIMHCQSLGVQGNLAVLRSRSVRSEISKKLRELTDRSPQEFIFFGLFKDNSNIWRWVDQTRLQSSDTNWDTRSEPNNAGGNENCGVVQRANGLWYDIRCDTPRSYICERTRNPCESDPCQNGGSCQNDGTSYICLCTNHFSGNRCQSVVDRCFSSPCLNGGSCRGSQSSYTCTCLSGYTGINCGQEL